MNQGDESMQIGILGSGDVGQALGKGFAARDYQVRIGSRTPDSEKLAKWLEENPNCSTGIFEETASFGEIVIMAVAGSAVEEVINLANPENLTGKIVIDVTNPLDFSSNPPGVTIWGGESLAEKLQNAISDAKVVKCWNTVPNSLMVDPQVAGSKPSMLICGNDADAKATVKGILQDFGWDDIIDVGDIVGARYLETQVALWVRISIARGTYNHAFRDLVG
jgi:8-hydroxy-5-deazaflavin:NADPH oxidoreductase